MVTQSNNTNPPASTQETELFEVVLSNGSRLWMRTGFPATRLGCRSLLPGQRQVSGRRHTEGHASR